MASEQKQKQKEKQKRGRRGCEDQRSAKKRVPGDSFTNAHKVREQKDPDRQSDTALQPRRRKAGPGQGRLRVRVTSRGTYRGLSGAFRGLSGDLSALSGPGLSNRHRAGHRAGHWRTARSRALPTSKHLWTHRQFGVLKPDRSVDSSHDPLLASTHPFPFHSPKPSSSTAHQASSLLTIPLPPSPHPPPESAPHDIFWAIAAQLLLLLLLSHLLGELEPLLCFSF